MGINIGMTDKQRETVAKGLSKLLADSYSLYLKTHNYHWNVTGPQFNSLHTMFETQYTELAAAVSVVRKKFKTPPADYAAAQKQMRFLAYRGFDGDTVRRALKQAWTDGYTEYDGTDDRT